MRYEVVNDAGEVVNVVEWDGETEWHPGEGFTVRPEVEPEPVIAQDPETD